MESATTSGSASAQPEPVAAINSSTEQPDAKDLYDGASAAFLAIMNDIEELGLAFQQRDGGITQLQSAAAAAAAVDAEDSIPNETDLTEGQDWKAKCLELQKQLQDSQTEVKRSQHEKLMLSEEVEYVRATRAKESVMFKKALNTVLEEKAAVISDKEGEKHVSNCTNLVNKLLDHRLEWHEDLEAKAQDELIKVKEELSTLKSAHEVERASLLEEFDRERNEYLELCQEAFPLEAKIKSLEAENKSLEAKIQSDNAEAFEVSQELYFLKEKFRRLETTNESLRKMLDIANREAREADGRAGVKTFCAQYSWNRSEKFEKLAKVLDRMRIKLTEEKEYWRQHAVHMNDERLACTEQYMHMYKEHEQVQAALEKAQQELVQLKEDFWAEVSAKTEAEKDLYEGRAVLLETKEEELKQVKEACEKAQQELAQFKNDFEQEVLSRIATREDLFEGRRVLLEEMGKKLEEMAKKIQHLRGLTKELMEAEAKAAS